MWTFPSREPGISLHLLRSAFLCQPFLVVSIIQRHYTCLARFILFHILYASKFLTSELICINLNANMPQFRFQGDTMGINEMSPYKPQIFPVERSVEC